MLLTELADFSADTEKLGEDGKGGSGVGKQVEMVSNRQRKVVLYQPRNPFTKLSKSGQTMQCREHEYPFSQDEMPRFFEDWNCKFKASEVFNSSLFITHDLFAGICQEDLLLQDSSGRCSCK